MAAKKKPTKKGSAAASGAANKTAARPRTEKAGLRKSSAMRVSSRLRKKTDKFGRHEAQDITERKKMEEVLRDSEMRYRTLFEQSGDYILVMKIGKDGIPVIMDMNETALRAHGYSREEMVGRPITFLDPVTDLRDNDERFKALRKGKLELFTTQHRRKDGSLFDVEVRAQLIRINGEQVIVSTERDVTERKRTEAALKTREKQLAESQRIAHIGSWERNLTTGKMFWSDELFRLFGLDPKKDPVDFNMYFNMIHPDDRPAVKKAIDETVKIGKHYSIDYRLILRDGTTRIIHAQAELLPDESGRLEILSGTAQDITERKKIEDARMFLVECGTKGDDFFESLAHYLAESLGMDYICIDRLEGDLLTAKTVAVYFDGRFEDNVSYTLHDTPCGDAIGKDVCCFPDGVRHRFPMDAILQDMKAESYVGVTLWSHAHQPIGLIALIGRRPLVNPRLAESILKLVAIRAAAELERKMTEEQIRESEQFIRNILDTVDEGFIVIDRDYRILTANKAYCGQASLPCDEAIGKHCYEVSHKRHQPCFAEGEECAAQQVFGSGEPHTMVHRHTDHDGHLIYVETKAFPIKDDFGRVTSVIETINNITERHLLEEERVKTQKLESIGTLAGGIAHDFNNLLQGLFGYISMAKMTLDQKEKSLAMLEQAEKALHQSVNLTTQLLTFSKGGKPVKKSLSLPPVIENAARFALSGSRSEYRISNAPDLRLVEADEGQLVQVIQNIVLNADQAMPLGGNVEIAAKNVSASDASLPRSIAGKDHVLITIQDSGVGIPEQYLGKIFDPYFTTKEKGSGLGLATSYSIIGSHGGHIDVRSQVGKGTVFLLYLPASEAVAEESPVAAAPGKARTGRILVMDDEKVVREVTGELLRALGHEAEFAESGESALSMYREAMAASRSFDVVILDLTIRGGMGGLETLAKLLEIDPGVKAVVSSGYSDDAALSNHREHGFRAFLKKPYNMKELQNTLNDLLG